MAHRMMLRTIRGRQDAGVEPDVAATSANKIAAIVVVPYRIGHSSSRTG